MCDQRSGSGRLVPPVCGAPGPGAVAVAEFVARRVVGPGVFCCAQVLVPLVLAGVFSPTDRRQAVWSFFGSLTARVTV
ncbi:MAG: hypothetical protein J2P14_14305 [Acidothermales bacterium]|nr:hypothetical protein [Acidothermales bacterium]